MEYLVALGEWSLMIAAPCTVSWFVGDMMGAARSRQMFAGSAQTEPPAGALVVEQWRLAGASSPRTAALRDLPAPRADHASVLDSAGNRARIRDVGDEQRDAPLVFGPAAPSDDQILEAEQKRRRRETFAEMPPLAELRAHVAAIRQSESVLAQSVWEDQSLIRDREDAGPIAQRVLRHYTRSIRELHEANADAPCPRTAASGFPDLFDSGADSLCDAGSDVGQIRCFADGAEGSPDTVSAILGPRQHPSHAAESAGLIDYILAEPVCPQGDELADTWLTARA